MQTEEGTSGSTRMALRNLRDLLARTKADLMADAPLLEQYTARRDEEAFAALLRRHGPMVLSLCRRLLHHEQDAEDAFQATFLLLAAKASAVRKRSSIASWLYGVAYRVAFRLRARDAARRRRERITIDRIGPAIEAEPTWREMTVALDEELAALSEDRRAPLLLCYIEGLTQEAAAHRLGWSHATFRRRLRAGLTLLRSRLAGRGLALPAGLLAVGLTRNAAEAALTTPLIDATARAAGSGAAGAVPDRVAVIVAEALRAMLVNHLKTLGVLLLTATVLVAGAGLLVRATWAGGAAPSVTVVDPEPTPKAPESDLPPGAVARMGTPGLRQVGSFYCLAFAPDGKMLAIAQMDSTIRLVEVATAREVRRLGTPAPADTRSRNYWVSALCFSPDGRRLASLQPGKGVTVWDAVAGKSLCQVATDLSYEPCSLAFAPDGKTLLTGGADGVARLWDSTTGTKGLALKGHDGRCLAVAFAPDGKRVATGGADESVRL